MIFRHQNFMSVCMCLQHVVEKLRTHFWANRSARFRITQGNIFKIDLKSCACRIKVKILKKSARQSSYNFFCAFYMISRRYMPICEEIWYPVWALWPETQGKRSIIGRFWKYFLVFRVIVPIPGTTSAQKWACIFY